MLRSLHFPQYVFPVASPHAASLISQPHPLLLTRIRLPAVSSRSSACFFPLHRVCFYPALAPHENILQHKTPLPFLCEKRDKLSALPPPPPQGIFFCLWELGGLSSHSPASTYTSEHWLGMPPFPSAPTLPNSLLFGNSFRSFRSQPPLPCDKDFFFPAAVI